MEKEDTIAALAALAGGWLTEPREALMEKKRYTIAALASGWLSEARALTRVTQQRHRLMQRAAKPLCESMLKCKCVLPTVSQSPTDLADSFTLHILILPSSAIPIPLLDEQAAAQPLPGALWR